MRNCSIIVLSVSLAAAVSACATTSDEGSPDGAFGETTAERSDELTMAAGMAWSGAPDNTLTFAPGNDIQSVTDANPGADVYQVLVDPRAGSEGTISVSNTWDADDLCSTRGLSVRAFARNEGSTAWYEIEKTDRVASLGNTGGEFPRPICSASASMNVTPSMAQVRVMGQARTRIGTGPLFGYTYQSVSVAAVVESPAPEIYADIKLDANASAFAVITNDGPVTADSVDADVEYEYDYCPPKQGDEPQYCAISQLETGTCVGAFCGPNTFVNFMRQPVHCSWSKDFDNVEIGANGGAITWIWNVPGGQPRCGLCDRTSNRCANAHAKVTARILSSPYDQLPQVTDSFSSPGVL